MNVIFEIKNLVKKSNTFLKRPEPIKEKNEYIFYNYNIQITEGEFVVFSGPNSSGKSTLLMLLIGEEKPDSGEILYKGENISKISAQTLMFYRRGLGLIFQDLKLINRKTVKDNVAMIPFSQGLLPKEVWKRTYNVLKNMGLLDYQLLYPDDLSSGIKQRLAIARALVNDPGIIIADEPTGNVDSGMEKEIFEMLSQENIKGKTVIVFTSKQYIIESLPAKIIKLK